MTRSMKRSRTEYRGAAARRTATAALARGVSPSAGPGAVDPDGGCAVETATGGGRRELGPLGPVVKLAPGPGVRHGAHRGVYDGRAKPEDAAAFVTSLAPAETSWWAQRP